MEQVMIPLYDMVVTMKISKFRITPKSDGSLPEASNLGSDWLATQPLVN